ncbi:MAG: hypothetical protein MK210_03465 [Dehalococcoidia bacterium]|nr:hypothetical protein [Dehalococcoidia bacterium]
MCRNHLIPPRNWPQYYAAHLWSTVARTHELSNYATLHPGDVIWMDPQCADGDMVPGDTNEVEISGIGTLRNYVVAEE